MSWARLLKNWQRHSVNKNRSCINDQLSPGLSMNGLHFRMHGKRSIEFVRIHETRYLRNQTDLNRADPRGLARCLSADPVRSGQANHPQTSWLWFFLVHAGNNDSALAGPKGGPRNASWWVTSRLSLRLYAPLGHSMTRITARCNIRKGANAWQHLQGCGTYLGMFQIAICA
jgi:hypothetical protein